MQTFIHKPTTHRMPSFGKTLCRALFCKKRACFAKPGQKPSHCGKHAGPTQINMNAMHCAGSCCSKQPTFALPGGKEKFCKGHSKPGMINIRSMLCGVAGCTKRPSFALSGQKAIRCKKHADLNMSNVLNKLCAMCPKKPSFGLPGGAPTHCKSHSQSHMMDVIHGLCKALGCPTRPSFGIPGGKAVYCKEHSYPSMINVVKRTCENPGCRKQPHFCIVGTTPTRCFAHSTIESKGVTNQSCMTDGCISRRSFGITKPTHCKVHAYDNMTYLMKPRCEECTALAWYGSPAQKAIVCAHHKRVGMISNPRQRCSFPACMQTGIFQYCKQRFCQGHTPFGATSLLVERCASCGLPDVLNANRACMTCDPEKAKRATHAKELKIKAVLDSSSFRYESYDRTIDSGLFTKARPDFLFNAKTHSVIVEVDENQHKSYAAECEESRMLSIAQALQMPTAFIRYNPDKYMCGRTGRPVQMSDSQRHKLLLKWLDAAHHLQPFTGVMVMYICYDGFVVENDDWKSII